jgi:hypothetical protein
MPESAPALRPCYNLPQGRGCYSSPDPSRFRVLVVPASGALFGSAVMILQVDSVGKSEQDGLDGRILGIDWRGDEGRRVGCAVCGPPGGEPTGLSSDAG